MKKIFLLPNAITAFSLCCGLFVIFTTCLSTEKEDPKYLMLSATGIIMVAAVADLLDGAIARAMKAESEFGGFFDSLADSISFGVAPAVVILKTLRLDPTSELSFLLITSAMIYASCGVLRLVRFSVTTFFDKEVDEDQKKTFTGLPIPAAAAAMISLNLFLISDEVFLIKWLSLDTKAWIIFVSFILIGYFMISRWKFPSLKNLRIRVASFSSIFLLALSAACIFYGIFRHFSIFFFIISWSYLFIAWILSIIRLILRKKSKTLEEFEPEDGPLDL